MDEFETETIKRIYPSNNLPYHIEVGVDRDVGAMVEIRIVDDACESSVAVPTEAVDAVCNAMRVLAKEIEEHQESL